MAAGTGPRDAESRGRALSEGKAGYLIRLLARKHTDARAADRLGSPDAPSPTANKAGNSRGCIGFDKRRLLRRPSTRAL
jgi:hypothetical protein